MLPGEIDSSKTEMASHKSLVQHLKDKKYKYFFGRELRCYLAFPNFKKFGIVIRQIS